MLCTVPPSISVCLGILGAGAFGQWIGALHAQDAEALDGILWGIFLPATVFLAFFSDEFEPVSAIVAVCAATIWSVACNAGAWLSFRSRARKQRILLASLSLGTEPTLALAWAGTVWGAVGVETIAVCCCLSAVFRQLGLALLSLAGTLAPPNVQHQDGGLYTGEWQEQKKDGLGIYKYPSGARHEGWWRKNVKHGYGVYTYADGGTYEGEFRDGQRHGVGVRRWADGRMKAASFVNGHFQELVALDDTAAVLMACMEAAQAARHAPVQGAASEWFRQHWHVAPPLVAAMAALWVRLDNIAVHFDVLNAVALISSATIPASLLSAGVYMMSARVLPGHVAAASSLVLNRALCASCLGAAVLVLTPQYLKYVMRAGALVLFFFSPMPFMMSRSVSRHRLDKTLSEAVAAVSCVTSTVLMSMVTLFAWLHGTVPVFNVSNQAKASSLPLVLVCIVMALSTVGAEVVLRGWGPSGAKQASKRDAISGPSRDHATSAASARLCKQSRPIKATGNLQRHLIRSTRRATSRALARPASAKQVSTHMMLHF